MRYVLVDGDLLTQAVDAIVNAWNRNVVPWWLLLPQGVAGAIRRRAGPQPFVELSRVGPIPLGRAVLTSAGRLPFKGIIHVAGINLLWRASEFSIALSVHSALDVAEAVGFESVAFPVVGAGSGGFTRERALSTMLNALEGRPSRLRVTIVRFAAEER